jgi:hypothetical protein
MVMLLSQSIVSFINSFLVRSQLFLVDLGPRLSQAYKRRWQLPEYFHPHLKPECMLRPGPITENFTWYWMRLGGSYGSPLCPATVYVLKHRTLQMRTTLFWLLQFPRNSSNLAVVPLDQLIIVSSGRLVVTYHRAFDLSDLSLSMHLYAGSKGVVSLDLLLCMAQSVI